MTLMTLCETQMSTAVNIGKTGGDGEEPQKLSKDWKTTLTVKEIYLYYVSNDKGV